MAIGTCDARPVSKPGSQRLRRHQSETQIKSWIILLSLPPRQPRPPFHPRLHRLQPPLPHKRPRRCPLLLRFRRQPPRARRAGRSSEARRHGRPAQGRSFFKQRDPGESPLPGRIATAAVIARIFFGRRESICTGASGGRTAELERRPGGNSRTARLCPGWNCALHRFAVRREDRPRI